MGQPGLCSAHLHVFALTLVSLQRDAGQPSDSVGHICIRQTGDHVGGQHVDDVVGCQRPIDRFDLSALTSWVYTSGNIFVLAATFSAASMRIVWFAPRVTVCVNVVNP